MKRDREKMGKGREIDKEGGKEEDGEGGKKSVNDEKNLKASSRKGKKNGKKKGKERGRQSEKDRTGKKGHSDCHPPNDNRQTDTCRFTIMTTLKAAMTIL